MIKIDFMMLFFSKDKNTSNYSFCPLTLKFIYRNLTYI